MKLNLEAPAERKPLETLLDDFGRAGGPTKHGWHTHEPAFRCWREYHLINATEDARPAAQQFALAVGTIVHEFLAAYYSQFITGQTSRPREEMRPEALYEYLCVNGYVEETNEARRLYEAYRNKYDGRDSYLAEDVKIIAIEHHVQRTFPWGGQYTARADMVLHMPDGYWLVDHKTAAARTAEFVEGWQVEPGILGLIWACSEEFKPVRGVSINGLIKTKVPEFDRFMYAADERLVQDWLAMMRYKGAEETLAAQFGWPPNYSACFRKMGSHVGKCRFFSRCVYGLTDNEG